MKTAKEIATWIFDTAGCSPGFRDKITTAIQGLPEKMVYVIDCERYKSNIPAIELTDAEFMQEATRQDLVFTLEAFQGEFNSDNISNFNTLILIK